MMPASLAGPGRFRKRLRRPAAQGPGQDAREAPGRPSRLTRRARRPQTPPP